MNGASSWTVIPAQAGIQVEGMGMDPGFHRGDDKAGMTEWDAGELRFRFLKPSA